MGYASRLIRVRFQPGIADKLYWMMQSTIIELYELAQTVDACVWLANDWIALPIAARLAKEKGGSYVYDTHEFAVEEYAEKLHWRMWKRPFVCAVERQYIGGAAVVSSVSAGISERLDAMYQLPRPSLVIRNTPFYQPFRFRPTGERIRVLYHGIIVIGRGLEQTIESVASWRPEFELTIRGPENPGYSDMLRQRIRHGGLENRVGLVPPVLMTALVEEATAFDIGFFALPGHSRHNAFALPNKFFEYIMAGLALCVSDLPEMARLVEEYQLGVLIPTLDPAAIASAINSFDRERIDACKRNALAAAEELCWERESARMVNAYQQLVPEIALG
ncbi:MAG: glycosyltransferase [Alphaproteobacteria bacterium]|nr:glycosyltransferase [Alphaproteobacteria bacterium]